MFVATLPKFEAEKNPITGTYLNEDYGKAKAFIKDFWRDALSIEGENLDRECLEKVSIIQNLFTKTVLENYGSFALVTAVSGVEIISSLAFGIGCWLIFWTLFVTLKQSTFRKY